MRHLARTTRCGGLTIGRCFWLRVAANLTADMKDKRASTHRYFDGVRVRAAISAAILALGLFVSSLAFAAGNVRLLTSGPQETGNNTWNIRMRIDLPREPTVINVPFRFVFMKMVYYERAIVKKGEPPVLNKMRLDPPKKNVISLDVKFSDALGKKFKSTIFEFEVRRSGGFDAGEYTIQAVTDDGDIGSPVNITLNGDNYPVDRTAIPFGGPPETAGTATARSTGDDTPSMPSAVQAVGTAPAFIPQSAYNEEVQDHPKGVAASCPVSTARR